MHALVDLRVVGQAPDDRHLTGPPRRDALTDEFAGVDQQARAHPFVQAMAPQVPDLLAQQRQRLSRIVVNLCFRV